MTYKKETYSTLKEVLLLLWKNVKGTVVSFPQEKR